MILSVVEVVLKLIVRPAEDVASAGDESRPSRRYRLHPLEYVNRLEVTSVITFPDSMMPSNTVYV